MKIKAPPGHEYGIGHDIFGNTFVAFKTRGHVDYIYGMFKGRELTGGHLDGIESWHKDGERVVFTDHPTKGNLILVMGIPITEITGDEADSAVADVVEKSRLNHIGDVNEMVDPALTQAKEARK